MIRKVIHIWGICGIGGLLSRYMIKYYPNDYESISIARKSHDVYNHSNEYTLVWDNRASMWLSKCLLKARKFDIIHIHSGISWIKYFRFLYPDSKIVIHLHGTKIRGRWNKYDLSKADLILVSTSDLLEESPDRTKYLPDPIDEELINNINALNIKKIKGKAFHVDRFAYLKAVEYAIDNKLELFPFNRGITPLDHKNFLIKMAEYEYVIDVKKDFTNSVYEDKILKAISLTGLEALALGCKVIDWNNEVIDRLPIEHKSENVALLLNAFYNRMYL